MNESIEKALLSSEYLILMASPESAEAVWVNRELDFWISHKPVDKILLVLTDGFIFWNAGASDFDWSRTTALPARMKNLFDREPVWVDVKWMRDAGRGNRGDDAEFRVRLAALAAPLLGKTKEELIGEDARLARRARLYKWTAITLLTALSLAFGWMFRVAERRRLVAAAERDMALISQSRYLADAGLRELAKGNPETAVLLTLEALPGPTQERPYVPEAEAALYTAMGTLGVKSTSLLTGFRPPLSAGDFSPDGTRLVTVDSEGVRIWDVAAGKQIATLAGHREPVWWAAYLPDGSGIVTASADKTARLWNAQTGSVVRVFEGHTGPLLHGAISSDGRLLATAAADSTAKIWRIVDGSLVATLKHAQAVCCISISPDSHRVVTASIDGTGHLWDVRDGKSIALLKDLPRRITLPAGAGSFVGFSPDSRWLATAHTDNTVRIWSTADARLDAVLKGHTRIVTGAAFSRDSRYLATASADGTARLWAVRDMSFDRPGEPAGELRTQDQKPPGSPLSAAAFSPDGNFIAVAGEDALTLFGASTREELKTIKLDFPADGLILSPDGRRMATLQGSVATLWETAWTNSMRWRVIQARERIDHADTGPAEVLVAKDVGLNWQDERGWEPPAAITRDGAIVAAATGRQVTLRNADTGQAIATLAGHTRVVSRLSFNETGTRLLTTSYDGSAKIWDTRTGTLLATLRGHERPLRDGAFQPGGDLIATASEDGTVRLWAGGGAARSVLSGHHGPVRRLSLSADGRRLITAADDASARIWDPATAREVTVLRGDKDGFGSVLLSANGDRAVTSGRGDDFTVRLWDAVSGGELHRWTESRGSVLGAALSGDGRVLLAWSVDGQARLWKAYAPYDRLASLGEGCPGFGAVAQGFIAVAGKHIVTILRNGRTDVWDGDGATLITLHTFAETRKISGCGFSYPPPVCSQNRVCTSNQ